jgi:hypothetical protein
METMELHDHSDKSKSDKLICEARKKQEAGSTPLQNLANGTRLVGDSQDSQHFSSTARRMPPITSSSQDNLDGLEVYEIITSSGKRLRAVQLQDHRLSRLNTIFHVRAKIKDRMKTLERTTKIIAKFRGYLRNVDNELAITPESESARRRRAKTNERLDRLLAMKKDIEDHLRKSRERESATVEETLSKLHDTMQQQGLQRRPSDSSLGSFEESDDEQRAPRSERAVPQHSPGQPYAPPNGGNVHVSYHAVQDDRVRDYAARIQQFQGVERLAIDNIERLYSKLNKHREELGIRDYRYRSRLASH